MSSPLKQEDIDTFFKDPTKGSYKQVIDQAVPQLESDNESDHAGYITS